MKKSLLFIVLGIAFHSYAQDKSSNSINYTVLTELKGTEYVIASAERSGKGFFSRNSQLLFINTKTGKTKQTEFPEFSNILKFEHLKIDSLKINVVIICATTIDYNADLSIDRADPDQIFIFSVDGQKLAQLTDAGYYTKHWLVNKLTGVIVISGQKDSNTNRVLDKTDTSELLVYNILNQKFIN
jgi:hypothetical protein